MQRLRFGAHDRRGDHGHKTQTSKNIFNKCVTSDGGHSIVSFLYPSKQKMYDFIILAVTLALPHYAPALPNSLREVSS